jgi:hypothetical protein
LEGTARHPGLAALAIHGNPPALWNASNRLPNIPLRIDG